MTLVIYRLQHLVLIYLELNKKILYRFWFSFVDPLLRGTHFKKIIENNFKSNIELNKSEPNNYFSFMDKNDLGKVFSKIF